MTTSYTDQFSGSGSAEADPLPVSRGGTGAGALADHGVLLGSGTDPVSAAGVVLVSCGIISLAFQGRKLGIGSLPYALGTGCFIGAYSVTDGIGARLSGAPLGYTVWMCLLWGLMTPMVYVVVRDARSLIRGPRETLAAARRAAVAIEERNKARDRAVYI